MSALDSRFMAMALALSERGLGNAWPNPAVGCVLVKDRRVVGRGWTQPGGRPHAESEAIGRAGEAARGSTAYVTLEPCAHHGRTPPCTDLMVGAGIARTVVAAVDPDPRVDGKGIARLRAAGMEVTLGCLEAEACRLNAGFFARMRLRRPQVGLKLATSADGRIATAGGDSKWITGAAARAEGHRLRLRHDAIVVGSGTALADDLRLTCRLPGLEGHLPVVVVLDRRLRLSPASKLVRSAATQAVWVFTTRTETPDAAALVAGGTVVHALQKADEQDQLVAMLATLAEQGITRLLVEGGVGIASAFLCAGIVDRLHLFDKSALIGDCGVPSFEAFGIGRLPYARRWRRVEGRPVDEDRLIVFEPA